MNKSQIAGLAFSGCMFIGMGIGMWLGYLVPGMFIGMGVGLGLRAVIKMSELQDKEREPQDQ
ncbi:MAG: hypothetical protein AAFR61_18080 [Bacteroidota bacterium]